MRKKLLCLLSAGLLLGLTGLAQAAPLVKCQAELEPPSTSGRSGPENNHQDRPRRATGAP